MAYKPVEEDNPINTAGLVLLVCFVSGVGIVTIKSKPARYLLGGKGGVALVIVLSTALIFVSIPTSTAIETDATGNPYGFTGEQQFGEADDLIYLRARYYSSSIGRFISRDPILEPMQRGEKFIWGLPYLIRFPQALNPYVYVRNNPINDIDPTGLGCDWGGVLDCFLGSHDWSDIIFPFLCIACLLSGGGPFCIVPCGVAIYSELLKLPDCLRDNCHKEPDPCE